jgi:subtilisin family serine protease
MKRAISVLLFLLLTSFVAAQESPQTVQSVGDGNYVIMVGEPGAETSIGSANIDGRMLQFEDGEANAVGSLGWIIEFNEKSVVEFQSELDVLKEELRTEISDLERELQTANPSAINIIGQIGKANKQRTLDGKQSELEEIASSERARLREQAGKIRDLQSQVAESAVVEYRYSLAYSGVSVGPEADIATLSRSNFVKAIIPVTEVTTTLSGAISVVGADRVQSGLDSQTGLSGDGVTIAVIDTGVDYTHPDLGGCLGNECKVIDGYDFVNNDADPMDDQGHGTHVAATAAGLNGIAPGASIIAYKVLAAGGTGTSSAIIAAIERSLDPNGDGDASDHYDIISMSLGSYAQSASDPMSIAVDRVVDAGVIAVVAAGNRGPRLETVGSPGIASNAITVGASDSNDNIADFSSRGFVEFEDKLILKPDIVAPGVNLCAALAHDIIDDTTRKYFQARSCGNNRMAISGTSMATPVVSGVAALLLQENPDLKPAQVKAILMQSAKDLGFPRYEQGAGRVDAVAAVELDVTSTPSVDFGIIRQGSTAYRFFELSNFRETPVGIEFAADSFVDSVDLTGAEIGDLISGQFSEQPLHTRRICIQPGESFDMLLKVSANPELGTYFSDVTSTVYDGCDYSNMIDSLETSISYVKKKEVIINFDVSSLNGYISFIGENGQLLDSMMNTGQPVNYFSDLDRIDVVAWQYFPPSVSGGNVKFVSYVKGIDLRAVSDQETLYIGESNTHRIDTNVIDLMASYGLEAYQFEAYMLMGDSRPLQFSNALSFNDVEIFAGVDGAFNDFYSILVIPKAKDPRAGAPIASENIMILPFKIDYPFEQDFNVNENNLRSVQINYFDNILFTEEYGTVFGALDKKLYDDGKFGLLLGFSKPPSVPELPEFQTLIVPDTDSFYYYFTHSQRGIDDNGGSSKEIINSILLPSNVHDSINVLSEPFTLEVYKSDIFDSVLRGRILSGDATLEVSTSTLRSSIKIVEPDGTVHLKKPKVIGDSDSLYEAFALFQVSCINVLSMFELSCEPGEYEIEWGFSDIIYGTDLVLTATANWNGVTWEILGQNVVSKSTLLEGIALNDISVSNNFLKFYVKNTGKEKTAISGVFVNGAEVEFIVAEEDGAIVEDRIIIGRQSVFVRVTEELPDDTLLNVVVETQAGASATLDISTGITAEPSVSELFSLAVVTEFTLVKLDGVSGAIDNLIAYYETSGDHARASKARALLEDVRDSMVRTREAQSLLSDNIDSPVGVINRVREALYYVQLDIALLARNIDGFSLV